MFPALPVSRLLFSLNDSDVPLHKPFNYLYALTQLTAYLPRDVQATVLNMLMAFLLNLLAVLFYDLGTVSSVTSYSLFAVLMTYLLVYAVLFYQTAKPLLSSASQSELDIVPFKVDLNTGPLTYRKMNSFRPLRELSEVDSVSARPGAGVFSMENEELDIVGNAAEYSDKSKDIECNNPQIGDMELLHNETELFDGAVVNEERSSELDSNYSPSKAAADSRMVDSASSVEAMEPSGGYMYRSVKSTFELQMQEIYNKVSSTVDIQQPPSPVTAVSGPAESADFPYYSGLSKADVRAMMDSSSGGLSELLLNLQKETAMVVSTTQQEQDDVDD